MSEKSLRIRGKFINKLLSKLEDLNDDLDLLSKVDRKISRKINKQRGGGDVADIKALQIATIKKTLELKKQEAAVKDAIDKASDLTGKITEINGALNSIKTSIDSFKIEVPDLSRIQLNVDYLTEEELGILSTAVTMEPPTNWATFSTANPAIAAKVGEVAYKELVPDAAPLPGGDA
jgi:hypothetical protein